MSSHSYRLLRFFLAGLALLATAFPSQAQTAKPKQGFLVTYLVYSGRPNPTVTISDPRQVAEIEKQLADTMATGSRNAGDAAQPVLGYNGIRIDRLDAAAEDSWYVVKENVLRVEGGKASEKSSLAPKVAVSGKAGQIEELLLALGTSSGALNDAILSVVRNPR